MLQKRCIGKAVSFYQVTLTTRSCTEEAQVKTIRWCSSSIWWCLNYGARPREMTLENKIWRNMPRWLKIIISSSGKLMTKFPSLWSNPNFKNCNIFIILVRNRIQKLCIIQNISKKRSKRWIWFKWATECWRVSNISIGANYSIPEL